MQEPEKTTQKCTPTPCCTIFLLLFIGFIFGFPVGFMAKDTVLRSYLKMYNCVRTAEQEELEMPLPGDRGVTAIEEIIIAEPVESVGGMQPVQAEGEKKDDEKKETEKKEDDQTNSEDKKE